MNKKKKFLGVLLFISVFAASIAVVMLLWNALIPTIVGWTAINYWQAAGLMILCRLLLGGFGRFGHGGFFGRRDDHRHLHSFKERMKGMSRDERHDFIREHMGRGHRDRDSFFGRNEASSTEEKSE